MKNPGPITWCQACRAGEHPKDKPFCECCRAGCPDKP